MIDSLKAFIRREEHILLFPAGIVLGAGLMDYYISLVVRFG